MHKILVIRLYFPLDALHVSDYFLDSFRKKITQISNFVKIRPMAAKLFHADGRTDRHDEDNRSLFASGCA